MTSLKRSIAILPKPLPVRKTDLGIWGLLVYIVINELINKITTLIFVDVNFQINSFLAQHIMITITPTMVARRPIRMLDAI
jgi:hypothetical protein